MFASSFLGRSSTSRSRSPSAATRTRAPLAVSDAKPAAVPVVNTSTTRSSTSRMSAATESEHRTVRGYDKGSLLGDVSKVLRAQMRARARKAASSATSSAYSSTTSLSSCDMSSSVVELPYNSTSVLSGIDRKEKEFSDEAGMKPFPSSSPLATPKLGPSRPRSNRSSTKSTAPRPSRSKSSRLAESLTRSSSKASKAAAPISSFLMADLLTNHLAPLPRFDPFEKRRRSESLSAIVRKDATDGKDQKGCSSPVSSKVCRRMSSWSCFRAARKPDGCAPSIHLLAL